MKTRFFSRNVILSVCAVSLLFAVSCKKDNDNDNDAMMYTVSGNATGAQMVPTVSTTANSNLTGTYNSSSNKLMYTISWTGLAATASSVSFYGPADIGSNASGAAQFDLAITTPGMDGSATGEVTLTEQQEADLLNGKWYYTVSNATYATGEIRGQLVTAEQ